MTEFQMWLEEHKQHFSTYSAKEIAERARLCGFPEVEIAQWETKEKFRSAA